MLNVRAKQKLIKQPNSEFRPELVLNYSSKFL